MISRRIIRIKVLQVLYAFYTASERSLNNTEKELFFSLKKTYDLYHFLFVLPVEIANHAQKIIDLRKKKHIPTEEDLNPKLRFVQNSVIRQIRENNELNNYLEASKLNWVDEEELIKKFYLSLLDSDFYKEYIAAEEINYKEELKLIELLFSEIILQSEELAHLLEEKSIYWNDDIDFVTSMIIKTIRKFKSYTREGQSLMSFFRDEEDRQYAKDLFRKAVLNHDELRDLVGKYTENWDIDRIAFMDKMILEMAITEFLYFPSIPTKVTLNEYIELSKYYSTQKSRNFINGILDKTLKALQQEQKIIKAGRGLME